MFDIHRFCKHHAQKCIALSYDDAFELGKAAVEAAISGENSLTIDTTSLLTGLYNVHTLAHPSAPEMLAGLSAAVFQYDIGMSPQGFLKMDGVPYAMENCGMGGDTIVTPNVSCLSALCAASAGITMIKHGSRSHTDAGKSGSSDFFEQQCRIPLKLEVDRMKVLIRECHIGYIDAVDTRFKRIHLQTMHRSSVSHLNHILGPITSPVDPRLLRRRVIGVNQVVNPKVVAETYRILNEKGVTHMDHLWVVRGRGNKEGDSIDEASIAHGGTEFAVLRDGEIQTGVLTADDFGIQAVPFDSLSIPKGIKKGDYSLAILRGEIDGPTVDLVYANAALLLQLADPTLDLRTHVQTARELIESGRTYAHVENIRSCIGQPQTC